MNMNVFFPENDNCFHSILTSQYSQPGPPGPPGDPGISVVNLYVDEDKHLKTVLSSGEIIDSGQIPTEYQNSYDTISKINQFLYELSYTELDYDYAKQQYNLPVSVGACSAISSGNIIGRNFDWHDDWEAQFIIKTPALQGRKKVIGVAGGIPELTIQFVENLYYSEKYKILPFHLQDGINEDGLFAEMNVVPYIEGQTKTVPLVEKRESVYSVMLVRYILDRFASVDDAVEYLQNYVEILLPEYLKNQGYDLHFMLKDASKTVVIEFINERIVVIDSNISTNFHLSGVTFNQDGSVDIVGAGGTPSDMGIEKYGSGLERWNLLNAANVNSAADMVEVMKGVKYSKTYTQPSNIWYSEFVGGSVTVDTAPSDHALQERIENSRYNYEHRDKDNPLTWLTNHSSVYDILAKEMIVSVQEQEVGYTIRLNQNAEKVSSVNGQTGDIVLDADDILDGEDTISEKLAALDEKAVQADWNQNDSTAPDYVKNRLCYDSLANSGVAENIYGETVVAMTFSSSIKQSYKEHLNTEAIKSDYPEYILKIEAYFESWDLWVEYNIKHPDNITKIDNTIYNYVVASVGYVILDRSLLSDENKIRFPSEGVYFNSQSEFYTKGRASIRTIVKTIDSMWLPVAEDIENIDPSLSGLRLPTVKAVYNYVEGKGFYTKPSGGIPASDLASGVIPDTEEAVGVDIVTSVSAASTDSQVPTAKAVYSFIQSLDGNGVAY